MTPVFTAVMDTLVTNMIREHGCDVLTPVFCFDNRVGNFCQDGTWTRVFGTHYPCSRVSKMKPVLTGRVVKCVPTTRVHVALKFTSVCRPSSEINTHLFHISTRRRCAALWRMTMNIDNSHSQRTTLHTGTRARSVLSSDDKCCKTVQ